MRNFLLIIAFTCACIYTQAQVNYVLNPSFEEHTECPWTYDQIKFANYWQPIDTIDADPTCTPEYCNACDSTDFVSVPYGPSDYHYARTGNGLANVQMYFDESISQPYQRDYLQGHLYKSLTAGKSYCVTFYVTLTQESGYAINHIGAYLDDGNIDTGSSVYCAAPQTEYKPQVVEGGIIIDTFHWAFFNDSPDWDRTWVQIQGNFVANGTERFITIGNFFDAAHTDTITLPPISPWGGGGSATWYLVDDVSVIESDNVPDAGKDTSIAKGDSVFLGPHEIALPYWWYVKGNPVAIDSGGGIWVKPDIKTTYILEQNLCGVLSYDSVTVNPTLDVSNLLNERSVKIYPNPAKELLTIQIDAGSYNSFTISNTLGEVVLRKSISGMQSDVNVKGFSAGMYYVTLKGESGVIVKKFLKE